MSKRITQYICQTCGQVYPKWNGKCEGCEGWNTLVEEVGEKSQIKAQKNSSGLVLESLSDQDHPPLTRYASEILEFDRVCGGGLVPGSVVLIGGDPGIGKSTLLLQLAADLGRRLDVLYVSGEEGLDQIRLRATRLGLKDSPVKLASSVHIEEILQAVKQTKTPHVMIIDSIQTMVSSLLESAPGSVTQVRQCTSELVQLAKTKNITILLVGHVTKEGTLAGPRVLEHMVDAVLYFEGEHTQMYRILRGVKNRFGPTHEIGVFEMVQEGLKEVRNPSELFLSKSTEPTPGSVIYAGLEGSRPLLVELQALVAPSFLSSPRRTVVGWDQGRLSMMLAVLEARCGLIFSNKDVYLNVAGGLKITEPGADFAVCVALISALKGIPIDMRTVVFGEVALSGEIRPVIHAANRLKEAEKLGFEKAWGPPMTTPSLPYKAFSKVGDVLSKK
jgi:DNA repair protein RadA/Sms